MNFILGSTVLDYNPLSEDYDVEFIPAAGSNRRALDGTLISNTIYKRRWTLRGYCPNQFEELAAKLNTQFPFQDHDGKTYQVDMTSFREEGYPVNYLGEYTLTLEEV